MYGELVNLTTLGSDLKVNSWWYILFFSVQGWASTLFVGSWVNVIWYLLYLAFTYFAACCWDAVSLAVSLPLPIRPPALGDVQKLHWQGKGENWDKTRRGAQCFQMVVKVAVQSKWYFKIWLFWSKTSSLRRASLCLEKYLDQSFMKFRVAWLPFYLT